LRAFERLRGGLQITTLCTRYAFLDGLKCFDSAQASEHVLITGGKPFAMSYLDETAKIS
jgi:hypothetical protein